MKDTLKVGDTHVFTFTVTEAQTVPALYPQSPDFTTMPAVFATALRPHLDDGEGSLGIAINVNHTAATPPGMKVTVHVTCTKVAGRQLQWHIRAEDEVDVIGEGTHDRALVRWDRFNAKVAEKAAKRAR
jgi:fluoroacetyl-CoA thioesterase